MPAYRTVALIVGLVAACAAPAAASAAATPGFTSAAPDSTAAADQRCADRGSFKISVQGATLCVSIDDPTHGLPEQLLKDWIERSARIVADYYAGFPAPRVALRLEAAPGGGVRGGRTTNDSGLVIQITVGRAVSAEELAADWVLVHEMVHLALPELGRRHNWLAEGLATYVEGIARAQFGNRDITDVWAEYRHSMPKGLPQPGEGGMDETRTWARTYWGGALFCLQADVAIRERTGNRVGLQTALRAILQQTGGYRADREIDDVLWIGDSATGTRVLQDLYRDMKAAPLTPDLELLWRRLGIPQDPASQPFDDHAPLAAIRIAITRKP